MELEEYSFLSDDDDLNDNYNLNDYLLFELSTINHEINMHLKLFTYLHKKIKIKAEIKDIKKYGSFIVFNITLKNEKLSCISYNNLNNIKNNKLYLVYGTLNTGKYTPYQFKIDLRI